jgi:hypothetical protein
MFQKEVKVINTAAKGWRGRTGFEVGLKRRWDFEG